MWHDFVNVIPPPGRLLCLRRYPEDTQPMFGTWDGASACVLVADGTWPIPWPFITRWKLAASAPPWPAVPAPPVWKDTYAHPPALNN